MRQHSSIFPSLIPLPSGENWKELRQIVRQIDSRFLGYSLIRLSNCTDRPTIEPVPRDDEPVVLGPGQLVTVSFTREGSPSPTTDRIRPLLLSTRLRAEPTGRAWSRSSPIDCHLGSLSFRRKRSEFQSNEIVDYIVSILRDILFRIIQKITPKITPKITRTGVIRILVLYIFFSHPVFFLSPLPNQCLLIFIPRRRVARKSVTIQGIKTRGIFFTKNRWTWRISIEPPIPIIGANIYLSAPFFFFFLISEAARRPDDRCIAQITHPCAAIFGGNFIQVLAFWVNLWLAS